jgi:hypothetical protein
MRAERKPILTRSQTANLIEDWVNNPNISLYILGAKYGIKPPQVSNLISRIWFYKRETFTTRIAARQSKINDEQLKLKLSA